VHAERPATGRGGIIDRHGGDIVGHLIISLTALIGVEARPALVKHPGRGAETYSALL
jgi:hypothetical protein